MSSDPRIMRMDGHGPDGADLETWEEIGPDALIEGTPVQRGRLYYDDHGLQVGVWDCTPMTTKMEPYSVSEFMHVLEGSVTIVHEDGLEENIGAGENFVIPKGTVCSWKQKEYIRKFFVIFDDPSGVIAADKASLRVIRPEPDGDLPSVAAGDPATFKGPVPEVRARTWFTDPTGQMVVGVWEATAMQRPVGPIGRCELMLPVKGDFSLLGDGEEFPFKTGEAAFVPLGAPYGWRSSAPVRKIFCAFTANAASAAAAVEAAE